MNCFAVLNMPVARYNKAQLYHRLSERLQIYCLRFGMNIQGTCTVSVGRSHTVGAALRIFW